MVVQTGNIGEIHQKMLSEVFVVEDRVADAQLICDLFSDEYDIQVVDRGQAAIDILRTHAETDIFPELVVLDLRLPNSSGFEVLDILRQELEADVSVVVFSSSDSKIDRERAYDLGADLYLTKPMDIDDFQKAILKIERSFLNNTE